MSRRLILSLALSGALAASACGQGSTPTTPTMPAPTSSATVSIVAGSSTKTTTAYNPNPATISKGGTLTWVNNDTTAHTSTSDAGMTTTWSSGSIAPGRSFSQTFNATGTFTYHCTIHPGMVGTVTVH